MITEAGKEHIRRYMAGFSGAIAHQIGVGIGNRPVSSLHESLHFETGRESITSISLSPDSGRIIFKAAVPEDYDGQVYEVALLASTVEIASPTLSDYVLTTFDSGEEEWVYQGTETPGQWSTSINVRLGNDALLVQPPSGATEVLVLPDSGVDLSKYSPSDLFMLAYHVTSSSATDSVSVRFIVDSGNYYTLNFPVAVGYNINGVEKGSAVPTGSPNWSDINQIAVAVKSGVGAGAVLFDGIRIQPVNVISPDTVMVARTIITPFRKVPGQIQNIEYELEVNL